MMENCTVIYDREGYVYILMYVEGVDVPWTITRIFFRKDGYHHAMSAK